MEQIGIEAVLKDEEFQRGISRMIHAMQQVTDQSETTANRSASVWDWFGEHFVITAGDIVRIAQDVVKAMGDVSTAGIKAASDWGEALDQLGDQFGMNAAEAATWATAMGHVGLTVDEGAQQLNYFTRQLDALGESGSGAVGKLSPFGRAMHELGISVRGAGGELKTFDEIMPEIMDAFKQLPAGVNASALAMELFGARGGSKFLDFLREGSEGLANATEMARRYGLVLTDEEVAALEAFGRAQNDMSMSINGFAIQIGMAMLPALTELVNVINDEVLPVIATWFEEEMPALKGAVKDFADWLKGDGKQAIRDFLDALLGIGEVVGEVVSTFAKLAAGIKTHMTTISGIMSGNFSAITLSISGFTGTFSSLVTTAFQVVLDALDLFGSAFSGKWDRVLADMVQLAKDVFNLTLPGVISGALTSVGATIGTQFATVARQGIDAMANTFKDSTSQSTIRTSIETLLGSITTVASSAYNGIVSIGKEIPGKIAWAVGQVQGAVESISTAIAGVLTQVNYVAEWAWNGILSLGQAIIGKIIDGLLGVADGVAQIARAISGLIGDAIGAATNLVNLGDKSPISYGDQFSRTPNLGLGASNSYANSSSTINNFNLYINSTEQTSALSSDFGIMRSLAYA